MAVVAVLLRLLILGGLFLLWALAKKRVFAPLLSRCRAYADERARVFVAEVGAEVAPVVAGRLPQDLPSLAPMCVAGWWRRFVSGMLLLAPTCLMLAAIAWNVTEIGTGVHDAVTFVAQKAAMLPDRAQGLRWRQPPLGAFVRVLAFLILLGCGARATFMFGVGSSGKSADRRRQERVEVERGGFFPVVLMLGAAAHCARAHRQWHEAAGACEVPRVQLRLIERVIWQANRIRYEIPRLAWIFSPGKRVVSHRRQALHAHAAQVVGALRVCEARQDTHPGSAFQDMAVMLVTIAERYAQGRLTCLLDEDQLGQPAAAAPREGLRFLILGTTAVASVTAAGLAGLPSQALDAIFVLVVTLGSGWFLRRQLPSASELLNLLRNGHRS